MVKGGIGTQNCIGDKFLRVKILIGSRLVRWVCLFKDHRDKYWFILDTFSLILAVTNTIYNKVLYVLYYSITD